MRIVSPDEARRIAVRAQLLDGSATGVLDTVRTLGFLQLDPIATVAEPQHLVLWNRLGAYDRAELDRLLWDERALFEWHAFVRPIEDLPLVRALMRRWRRSTRYSHERWAREFVAPKRSRMRCAQSRRAARNLATSSRKSLCALKKNDRRWPKRLTSSPASIAAST